MDKRWKMSEITLRQSYYLLWNKGLMSVHFLDYQKQCEQRKTFRKKSTSLFGNSINSGRLQKISAFRHLNSLVLDRKEPVNIFQLNIHGVPIINTEQMRDVFNSCFADVGSKKHKISPGDLQLIFSDFLNDYYTRKFFLLFTVNPEEILNTEVPVKKKL